MLYEKAKEISLEQLKNNFIKEYEENRFKIDSHKNESFSFLYLFAENIMKQIYEAEMPKDININCYSILSNLPKEKQLFEFINDYLSTKNEIILFYLPQTFVKTKKKRHFNSRFMKEKMYEDSKYIYNLNEKKYSNNKQKIDLVCLIDDNHFYDDAMTIDYEYVNKLYFVLNDQSNDVQKLFGKINKYLCRIEHKENIEEIYFNNSFSKASRINKNKTYLESLVDEYFRVLKNIGTKNLNSLKKIDCYDDHMVNKIQMLKLRFNLMKIFGENNIVTPNLLESNISEEKALWQKTNVYEYSNTKYKTLYINFEYNSPYQNMVFNFCEKYINDNRNLNTLIFYNFGMINHDEECYKKIKSIKKIKVPELIQIFYDKNWTGKDMVNQTINI